MTKLLKQILKSIKKNIQKIIYINIQIAKESVKIIFYKKM